MSGYRNQYYVEGVIALTKQYNARVKRKRRVAKVRRQNERAHEAATKAKGKSK